METQDNQEAIDLLAAAVEADRPDRKGEKDAAEALLAALLRLNVKGAKIRRAEENTQAVCITIGTHWVLVRPSDNQGLVFSSSRSQGLATVPGLFYNPSTKQYEGADLDVRLAPIPGKPQPRKNAVAV